MFTFCTQPIKMILGIVIVFQLLWILQSKESEENSDVNQEQVVVRAVFINCEPNEEQTLFKNDDTRFQREELFKHSVLQDCRKKLALTVKITSEPGKASGDEYIPIEHVFDGSNKRRARLLDPYILRLRRDIPLQAYKLSRVDTVTGIITESDGRRSSKSKKRRIQRDLKDESLHQEEFSSGYHDGPESAGTTTESELLAISDGRNNTGQDRINACVRRDTCSLENNPAWKRDKRHEHNIIVEDVTDDYKIPWTGKDGFNKKRESTKNSDDGIMKSDYDNARDDKDLGRTRTETLIDTPVHKGHVKDKRYKQEMGSIQHLTTKITTHKGVDKQIQNTYPQKNYFETAEKNFELYDIGSPDLWYNVHVQLFEKMSTPEGKTVWNDITKGEIASVGTAQPEWMDQDLNVRYKSTEWISKDEFALPTGANLCLLTPMHDKATGVDDEDIGPSPNQKYIIVPKDDVMGVDDGKNKINKRERNLSDSYFDSNTVEDKSRYRRVLVRVSRALLPDIEEVLKVLHFGGDHFLTLPHRRQHHAQIDLEASADGNQLIRVGSSGSLITIVTDNSRRSRSVITVQATNKGLAAARFRVKVRDCSPEMANMFTEKGESITVAGPILVAPRHTQRFRLDLPSGLPIDAIHCSVALVNDDEESLAVRDVAVKKGDRCFCVWHCECVCLNEDPKLLCREMAEARQAAAGLSPHERTRRARSVCYQDCATVNIFVIVVGVLIALLSMGLAKACLGLFCRCVGKFGLDQLVQLPRKLDRYYEPSLQGRAVVYDDEGWPVHPDTKKRNVRQMSRSLEFLLNLTIFITLPCVLVRDFVKHMLACSKNSHREHEGRSEGEDKKCFSTHDMQGRHLRLRRKRGGLRRWMSPQAEELSTDIWTEGIHTKETIKCEFMRPLLQARRGEDAISSCVDSEQDDTDYVLMQMQKSKESLARSQKKHDDSGTSSIRKSVNPETVAAHTVAR